MPVIRNLIELSNVSSNTTYSSSSSTSKILGVVNNARYEGDDDNTATRIKELNDTQHDGGILYIGGYAYKIDVITPVRKSPVTLSFENRSSLQLFGDGGETDIAFIKATPLYGGPVRYFAALDDSVGSLPPIKSISTGQIDFDPAGNDVKINLSTGSNVITVVPDVILANDAFSVNDTGVLSANVLANDKGSNLSVTALSVNGAAAAVGTTFTTKTAKGFDAQVTLNANGTLTVDPSDALATALKLGQTDSLSLTYTAGGKTASAAVTINGTNIITAVADVVLADESDRNVFNLLTNDYADSGNFAVQSVSYNGVTYGLGQTFQITGSNGATAPASVTAVGLLVFDTRGSAFADLAAGEIVNITGISYTIVDRTDPKLTSTATVTLQVEGEDPPVIFDAIDDAITSTDDFTSIIYNVLTNDQSSAGTTTVTSLAQNGVALTLGVESTFTTEGGLEVLGTLLPTGELIIIGKSGNIASLTEGQTDKLVLSYQASHVTTNGATQTDAAQVTVTFTGTGTDDRPNSAPVAVADTLATGQLIKVGTEVRVDITDQFLFNDFDVDGDAIAINDLILPANTAMQFSIENGRLFVSTLGNAFDHLNGTDVVERIQFSYSIVDEHGAVSNYARADIFVFDI